jgi:proline dehydrogenase
MESINSTTKSDPEPTQSQVNFGNTEIAFSYKKDFELKKMAFLFRMFNSPILVKLGSFFTLWAVKLRIPGAEWIIKQTIFDQFVGGDSLLHCQPVIDKLYSYHTLTVLDYGAEGKTKEDDLDEVMEEYINAVEMAASNNSVPVISIKVTGLGPNALLEKMDAGEELDDHEVAQYDRMFNRVDKICEKAHELEIGVFIDAEETWMQKTIDKIALELMSYYNKKTVIVYNTYQMYLKDKFEQLKRDHQHALANEFMLGAKLVRGAYMQKEGNRAEELGYPSPIQPSKDATDQQYNTSLVYCLDNYTTICFCNASHNLDSNLLQAKLISERGLDKSHRHLNFCQLYGMSDYITFNLASAGYNVAKYTPYGPVKEVIPYLIRRAQENTSVTGEASRELANVLKELKRRRL